MDEKTKNDIALFRYGIIAPLIQRQLDDNRPWVYFNSVKDKYFEYIDGSMICISPSTMDRWYKAYIDKGFDGLKPISRSDIGKSRRIDKDLENIINFYIEEYPRLPATQIYEKLISNGDITSKELSLSTITRYVSNIKKENNIIPIIEKRRYEKEHINEVWYGDTTYGPYIMINNKKIRVYIIALIDDASRMIVGCEAFLEDNFINLMKVIKSAISKYGKPKLFSFDNGPNYRSNQIKLLGARIGVAINYCPPYTPTSKSKIERFFKTLKDQYLCLIKPNDYHDLDNFNKDLKEYINTYNTRVHSSLNGLSPTDRFFNESELIIEMNKNDIDKAFLIEIERKVSSDSVVIIDGKEYEVDYKYQNQKVLLRYSSDLSLVYIVNKEDNTLSLIKLLDKKSNSNIKREKIKLSMIGE